MRFPPRVNERLGGAIKACDGLEQVAAFQIT